MSALLFMACGSPSHNNENQHVHFTTTQQPTQDSAASHEELPVLRVVAHEGTPGHLTIAGSSYGYQYDLLRAYASHLGASLTSVTATDKRLGGDLLRRGEADFELVTLDGQTHSTNTLDQFVPIGESSYVVLTHRKRAASVTPIHELNLYAHLRQGALIVSEGFKQTKSYDKLLDSLQGEAVILSTAGTLKLVEQVAEGKADYVICEESEAQLACALMRQVTPLYDFPDRVEMAVRIDAANGALYDEFTAWLRLYSKGSEYAALQERYFDEGMSTEVARGGGMKLPSNVISLYDDLFRRVSQEVGYDWRFLAAIAYSESNFNPYSTSHRGAKGLMQVMPAVDRRLGDGSQPLSDPEYNVRLSVTLLQEIESSLRFEATTPLVDRQKIILACYNAGIGHVLDARNLARKSGEDPNSWEQIAHYLRAKADPAIELNEVVKCGSFNSGETLAYVDKVLTRYDRYRRTIAL